MSIYCALIHNNSTVKHIYIKYVFLLHGASSLAVLYGSGSHQSPSGEYKTQLYPLLLIWERTSPCPPPSSCIYPLHKPCRWRAEVRGWPCTPVGLWVLQDPARAGGGKGVQAVEGRSQVQCLPPVMLQEYPESRMLPLLEEVGKRFVWAGFAGEADLV